MKFCPNCGFPLEGKNICTCGYNVKTGEVDNTINETYNKEINDNINSFINNTINNHYDNMTSEDIEKVLMNAKKMGINSNISDDKIIDSINSPIFNKDNDSIKKDLD